MAIEVTKVYTEHFPALRFIGMRYTNDDREDGGFGKQWSEWWAGDRFNKMKGSIACAPFVKQGFCKRPPKKTRTYHHAIKRRA